MNTVGFRTIQELQNSNGVLKGFNQVVVITDDVLGGTFKTIRKGDAVIDGGVHIQGDLRYDLKRVYDNINVDVVWFQGDLDSFFNYCADNDQYAYMSSGEYDLGGASVELPANLKIKSGSGYFTNGTLIGDNTYFELNQHHKLFDPSIVFEGEWKGITVTPQNFGAITNKDNTVFENDCSAAIQAAIDSPFKVHFPVGYYYFTEEMYIHKAKSITLEKGVLPGDNRYNDYILDLQQDHTRIYTDQDVDCIIIRAEHVYVTGGIFDYSKAVTITNKAVFRYDLDYRIWGGEINTVVIGNGETLTQEGNGITGMLVDNTNKTNPGYVTYLKWGGYMKNVKVSSEVQQRIGHNAQTWVNSINIDINVDGFKQLFLMSGVGASTIKCIAQTRKTLAESEKDLPSIIATSAVIDYYCWDISVYRGSEAPYGPSGIVQDLGECIFHGLSHNAPKTHSNNVPFTPYPVVNPRNSVISKHNWDNGMTISLLQNYFGSASKRFTVTAKAHSGAGFDFDTNLNESGLPETSNIVLENFDNLFHTKASLPPRILFTESADLDNDFVEIIVSGNMGSLKDILINILGENFDVGIKNKNSFKRIQIIKIRDGVSTQYNQYPTDHGLFRINSIGTTHILIIRFIGARAASHPIRLLDICVTQTTSQFSPYLTTDGGQRIYGSLDVERVRVKSTTLETNPVDGCIETDGTNLYFVVGGVRKQITLTDL